MLSEDVLARMFEDDEVAQFTITIVYLFQR